MSEQTQQQRLEAEFPSQMLGSVTKGGTKLTYVPVSEVIQRLNDVLGMTAWSWETERVWRDEHDPDWVLAVGRMTATIDGVTATKAGEGGVKVKRTRTGDEIVDLGDEFKGAASDALKKAAQKFGVALYLSRKPDARRYEAPNPTRDPIEEGWESAEEAQTLVGQLASDIKAAGPDMVQAMRGFRDRLGVIWPPTRDEYDSMRKEVERLGTVAAGTAGEGAQSHAEPPEPPSAPTPAPNPSEAAEHAALDAEEARFVATEAYVKSLSTVELLVEFGKHSWTAPRQVREQRTKLTELLAADADWQPPAA